MYDTDGSGSIDFTEFMVVYHIMNEGTPEEVMSKIFRVFDLNGDGVITAVEMNKIIKVGIYNVNLVSRVTKNFTYFKGYVWTPEDGES